MLTSLAAIALAPWLSAQAPAAASSVTPAGDNATDVQQAFDAAVVAIQQQIGGQECHAGVVCNSLGSRG